MENSHKNIEEEIKEELSHIKRSQQQQRSLITRSSSFTVVLDYLT